MDNLQKEHQIRDRKAMADIIWMVKHAADAQNPLLAELIEDVNQQVAA